MPTKADKLHEWYRRCMERKGFFEDYQYLAEIRQNYSLDYVIVYRPVDEITGDVIWSNDFFNIIELE